MRKMGMPCTGAWVGCVGTISTPSDPSISCSLVRRASPLRAICAVCAGANRRGSSSSRASPRPGMVYCSGRGNGELRGGGDNREREWVCAVHVVYGRGGAWECVQEKGWRGRGERDRSTVECETGELGAGEGGGRRGEKAKRLGSEALTCEQPTSAFKTSHRGRVNPLLTGWLVWTQTTASQAENYCCRETAHVGQSGWGGGVRVCV